jgi:predicted flavoprotein YhiN
MQINGGQFSSVYTPRNYVQDTVARPPVVIDVTPDSTSEQSFGPVVDTSRVVAPTNQLDSQVQSRFVRAFANRSTDASSDEPSAQQLPRSVQQYLQVSQLPTNEESKRLVDEQV